MKIILFFLNITIIGWPFFIILLLIIWILFIADEKESKYEIENNKVTPLRANSPYPRKFFKTKYSREAYFRHQDFIKFLSELKKSYFDWILSKSSSINWLHKIVIHPFHNKIIDKIISIVTVSHKIFMNFWIFYSTNFILFIIFYEKRNNSDCIEFIIFHTKSLNYSILLNEIKFSRFFWLNIVKFLNFQICQFLYKFFEKIFNMWKSYKIEYLRGENNFSNIKNFIIFFFYAVRKEIDLNKRKNFIKSKQIEASYFRYIENKTPRIFYDPFVGINKIKKFTFNVMLFIFFYFILLYIPISEIDKYIDTVFFEHWREISIVHNWDLIISLDGLSILFILLTAFTFPLLFITFITSKGLKNKYVNENIKELSVIFILIEVFLLLAFMTNNFFFFFFFFESSLILFIILLNIWGGKERKYHAAWYLLFFTLLGSVLLLTVILMMSSLYKTCDITIVSKEILPLEVQKIFWICFFLGFAVKIPIIPFHIWLPEAHVEAPTAGSIVLAALTLKIGTYGLLRFAVPLLKEGIEALFSWTACLCLISAILSVFIAIFQTDLKKIIAYSSISHMNYAVLSITLIDHSSLISSVNYMIAHAFSSTALFFCIGLIYDKTNTRELLKLNNLININPVLAGFFFLFNIVNIGFPFTYSFFAEITILFKLIQLNFFLFILMSLAVLVNIFYTFWFLHNILYEISKNKIRWNMVFNYITKLEFFILLILFFFNIYFSFSSGNIVDGFLQFITVQYQ